MVQQKEHMCLLLVENTDVTLGDRGRAILRLGWATRVHRAHPYLLASPVTSLWRTAVRPRLAPDALPPSDAPPTLDALHPPPFLSGCSAIHVSAPSSCSTAAPRHRPAPLATCPRPQLPPHPTASFRPPPCPPDISSADSPPASSSGDVPPSPACSLVAVARAPASFLGFFTS
jgi:hypothetical protein